MALLQPLRNYVFNRTARDDPLVLRRDPGDGRPQEGHLPAKPARHDRVQYDVRIKGDRDGGRGPAAHRPGLALSAS